MKLTLRNGQAGQSKAVVQQAVQLVKPGPSDSKQRIQERATGFRTSSFRKLGEPLGRLLAGWLVGAPPGAQLQAFW